MITEVPCENRSFTTVVLMTALSRQRPYTILPASAISGHCRSCDMTTGGPEAATRFTPMAAGTAAVACKSKTAIAIPRGQSGSA